MGQRSHPGQVALATASFGAVVEGNIASGAMLEDGLGANAGSGGLSNDDGSVTEGDAGTKTMTFSVTLSGGEAVLSPAHGGGDDDARTDEGR